MTFFRTLLLLALLTIGSTGRLPAQPTNAEAFQQLASACLAVAPDTVQVFQFEGLETMPYLRTPLLARWQTEGRQVFLPDSAHGPPELPRLRVVVEEARVRYTRAARRQVSRTVTLGLRYTLTDTSSLLLGEAACHETYDDVVPPTQLPRLASPAFPETQAEPPPAGWFRRYAQPAILAAATAVTIYLFFSLRSDRSDAE